MSADLQGDTSITQFTFSFEKVKITTHEPHDFALLKCFLMGMVNDISWDISRGTLCRYLLDMKST